MCRFLVPACLSLLAITPGKLHATILGRVKVSCPLCKQEFKAVVATSVDTSAGVDRDLFARSAGPQPVFYKIATCPRCYYSGYVEDFESAIMFPVGFRDRVMESPKLDPGMTITPKTDQRAIPAGTRYRLAAQCYQWRKARSEAMAWLYLRASWVARDGGSVMPRTDRLQRMMGFVERWLPKDTGKRNQADRELELTTRLSAEIAEGRFSRYQLPYARFVLAMLLRRHGENRLFETIFPQGHDTKGLPELLGKKLASARKSIEVERRYQRLALEQFRGALDAGEVSAANRPAANYLVAELYRRLGSPNRALRYYDRAIAEPELDPHLATWARQQRGLVAPLSAR